MNGPILVTGAGGFIGRAVTARLARTGYDVRAGLRAPSAAADPRIAPIRCDLDVPGSLGPALDGAGAVVHAAFGAVDRMPAQLGALIAAAAAAGVNRVVLFSSVAVYGERDGMVGEDDAPRGRIDVYGQAKRACEALLRAWVAEVPDRRAVILRPGIVYGPGSRLWIDDLATRIRAGAFGTFGRSGEGVAGLIHVADVAEATRLALEAMERDVAGPCPAFNLVGPDQPTWNAYFAALAGALGVGALRDLGLGELALRQALAVPMKLAARAGVPVPPVLAAVPLPAEMRLYARKTRYDASRAEALLGWRPTVRLAEGLAASLPGRSEVEHVVARGARRQHQTT